MIPNESIVNMGHGSLRIETSAVHEGTDRLKNAGFWIIFWSPCPSYKLLISVLLL